MSLLPSFSARLGLLLALLPLAACGSEDEPPPPDTDPPAADEGIQVAAGLERASYAAGDSMRVFVTVSNRLDVERTLRFRTSQRYDFRVLSEDGEEIYRWSDERSFSQVLEEEQLQPREEGPEWEEWIPAPSEPGRYRIEVVVPAEGADLRTELPVEITAGSRP